MDKLFQNKWAIRVISLILALTLYFFVNLEANSEQNESRVDPGNASETQVLEDVPLDIKIDAENYVVSGVPEVVSVTLEGKRSSLAPIVRLRNFDVIVDLTDYEEGDHTVTLEYEGLPENVTAYIEPKEIDVTIESRATEQFGVDIDLVNEDKLPVGYELGEPEIAPETVTLVSSREQIEQVAMVKAFVDVRDLKESIRNKEVPIVVYDAQGNDMNVRVEPETVTISIPVERPSKTVDLNLETKGDLPDDIEIKNMEIPSEIEIFGKKELLSEIDQISTEELDMSKIENSGKQKVALDFPDGITSNDDKVDVDIELEQTKQFKEVPIEVIGKDESDVRFVKPKDPEIEVTIKGSDEILKKVNEEDVKATIDLSGLEEGEHKVDVQLEGPEDVTLKAEPKEVTVEGK
ncbi:MAG TPA: CdaR family protein [Pseudogracilibacillus sp.]|nr:CdaR family protein [Pseudogracilibacillus sp.]